MTSPKSTPIDYSGLVVKVTRVPGSHEEHFGTPVRTPDSVEVNITGTLRIALAYDRTECADCTSWDGMRCSDGFDKEGLEAEFMRVLSEELPFRIWSEELEAHILLTMFGVTKLEPSFALVEVLDFEVESR